LDKLTEKIVALQFLWALTAIAEVVRVHGDRCSILVLGRAIDLSMEAGPLSVCNFRK
jgi:hypothetical protein